MLLAGEADEARAWQQTLERRYRPNVRVFNLTSVDWPPPALVKGNKPARGAVAWVCKGMTCLAPIASVEDIEQALASGR